MVVERHHHQETSTSVRRPDSFELLVFFFYSGPSKVYGDQSGVVKNCSLFESTLTKKHNAIAYHAVRWAVAAKEVLVGWINSERNIADGMTKALTHGLRRQLFGSWMY